MSNMSLLFDVSFAAYILSGIAFLFYLISGKRAAAIVGYVLQAIGFASGIAFFVTCWVQSGYPPMRNLYESLTLMAHCVVLLNLVQSAFKPVRFLGPASGLTAGLLLAWAASHGEVQEHTLPALQHSFWLTTHVFLSMLSYAAVLVGALASLFRLSGNKGPQRIAALSVLCVLVTGGVATVVVKVLSAKNMVDFDGPAAVGGVILASAFVGGSLLLPVVFGLFDRFGLFSVMERDDSLRSFIDTMAILALALMSLAVITGSVWGDVAWGRYWGWDPKEVWAFITWLSLLVYIHTRFYVRPAGTWAPWILVVGLLTVLFNYFGVNFLLAGLHSYAG